MRAVAHRAGSMRKTSGSGFSCAGRAPAPSNRAWRRVGSSESSMSGWSRARTHFREPAEYAEFTDGYRRLERLRVQIAFFQGLKTLLRTWRLFHASLAVFLVITISAHIAVSLYLGYGWKR